MSAVAAFNADAVRGTRSRRRTGKTSPLWLSGAAAVVYLSISTLSKLVARASAHLAVHVLVTTKACTYGVIWLSDVSNACSASFATMFVRCAIKFCILV